MNREEKSSPFDQAIRLGLTFVFAFAPLAFGGVHTWAYGIVWGVLWFLLSLWWLKMWITWTKGPVHQEMRWVQAGFQPFLVLFVLWVLFQLVPLPARLLNWIQPSTIEVHRLTVPFTAHPPSLVPISLYPHVTKLGFFHLWSYVTVFYLTLYHLEKRKHLLMMVILWLGLGGFEALYGLIEHQGGTHRIWWWTNPYSGGVGGTFINKNHLAGYLGMIMTISVGLLFTLRPAKAKGTISGWRAKLARLARDDSWAKAIPVAFCCVLMGAGLLLSLSRGAVLALMTVLLPAAVLLTFKKNTRWYGILGLVLLAAVILYSVPLGLDPLLERFSSLSIDLEGRKFLWADTWRMIRSFLIAGTGFGSFEGVYPGFKSARFGASVLTHAHNEWFETWAETGIFGISFVSAGVVLYLLAGTKRWLRRRDRWNIYLGFGALAAVAIQVTHGLVEFHLHTPGVGLTLAGVMAWGWIILHHHKRGPNYEALRWRVGKMTISRRTGKCVLGLAAMVHVLFGMALAMHLAAEATVPTIRNSTVARAEVRNLDMIKRAIDLEPGNARRWAWLAREVDRQGVPERLEDWAKRGGLEPYKGRHDAKAWAVSFVRQAIQLNPTSPEHYAQLGWLLVSRPDWHERDLAERALRASLRLEPANPLRYFRLGQYYLLVGLTREADQAFQDAVELNDQLQPYVDEEWDLFSNGKTGR